MVTDSKRTLNIRRWDSLSTHLLDCDLFFFLPNGDLRQKKRLRNVLREEGDGVGRRSAEVGRGCGAQSQGPVLSLGRVWRFLR